MGAKKKGWGTLLLMMLCAMALFGGCGVRNEEAADEQRNAADEEATEGLKTSPQAEAGSDQGGEDALSDQGQQTDGEPQNVGEFSMQDLNGETYTQEMFADYDLTMVNVFATWCTPCINEIPDLERLYQEMTERGVNVVGIALDTLDLAGEIDAEAVEKAKLLAERTKATYPFLVPDTGYLNGRIAYIEAVPETFFVDSEGNIVGETYSGSRSLEEWKEIVETELKGMEP